MGSGSDPIITYSQEDRLLAVKTQLGETTLLLERFSGEEALSQPFEFKLTMLSTDFQVDIKSLLRTSVTITLIMADGTSRYFNGVFTSITQAKSGADLTANERVGGVSNPDEEMAVYEGYRGPEALVPLARCRLQDFSEPDRTGDHRAGAPG
ncbi:MAG: contractile injection system protein, VgrG/Pvc8 family [Ignavibacteriota bacterium]